MRILLYFMAVVLNWPLLSTRAFPHAGLDLGSNRTRRDAPCKGGTEYLHGNICCLNCPAGTHVKSHCTRAGERGECEECDYGTFIKHSNSLNQCFKCIQCRSDQETVQQCSNTHNTVCQCKAGEGFCDPNQACEVCKRCLRCEKDEEMVRNCTPTIDAECKKIQSKPAFASEKASWFWILILPAVICLVLVTVVTMYFGKRQRESQRNPPEREKRNGQSRMPSCSNLIPSRQPVRATLEEREELCESLSSSASNSQHSLTILPSSALLPPPPKAILVVPRQPNMTKDDKQFPKLIPVKGEESLRKCFEYFEEMDLNYHKRFFRALGITDNVIKSKDSLCYEDRIHELLNIWLEKEGRSANLNDLLKTLHLLDQRGTAETIEQKAVENNHYIQEN